jgi:ferredoxin
MLQIREELCLGCGLCVRNCPLGAIAIFLGKARIDTTRCNNCYNCVSACPQGAIQEEAPLNISGLRSNLQELQAKINQLSVRLRQLEGKR